MRCRYALSGVVLAGILLIPGPAGAQGTDAGAAVAPVPTPAEVDGHSAAYTLGPGDVLHVQSFQHDEISGDFPVEEDGTITFPLLGKVTVAGLTPAVAAAKIERLLEKDYYVDVQIQAEVKKYRSRPVTVLGEVRNPGTYYLEGPTTLAQIVAEAGGLKPSAGATVEVRRQERDPATGKMVQKTYTFPADHMVSGSDADIAIRAGDIVWISAKQLCFVTGEVGRAGQYELHPGMTLMQAISQAGGLGKFASQEVEVHREVGGEKQILRFDLGKIRKGKQKDPRIQADDVIIVRRRFF